MTNDTAAQTAASNDASESIRQGPGRLIRLARERARLGLPELAGLTKLAPATLEALERDDFTVLSEPVYVRGYYRKCAKALSISEQELLAAYEKLVSPRAPSAPTKLLLGGSNTGSSLKKNRRRIGTPWWLWLAGIVVVVGIAAWVLRENPGDGRAASSPAAPRQVPAEPPPAAAPATPPTPAPEASAPRPLSTNELSTTPAESGQSAAQASAAAEPPPAVAAASEPVVAATAPEAGAAPASADALTLEFKATSWVRIEDAGGKVLLSGVIQQGDRQVIAGKPPYSLFLGNAPGVGVSYRGKAVDLATYTRAKDNTARLSVPASD